MAGGVPDLERERAIARRRLLGWAAACVETEPGVDLARDIRLERGPDGLVDLARVEAVDALAQSLELALTTLLGSDVFNTQFGFDGLNALAEETNPLLARERIRVAVIQVLRKEPRVRHILDVKLDDGRLDRVRAGTRELDVRVSFETVAGERAVAKLGKVVLHV